MLLLQLFLLMAHFSQELFDFDGLVGLLLPISSFSEFHELSVHFVTLLLQLTAVFQAVDASLHFRKLL